MAEARANNIVRNTYRIRLLHLSDLHERVALDWMKEERRAKIARTRAQRYRVLSNDFFATLRNIQKQRPVDMVCSTGDIADWGLKEEYEDATERFKSILGTLGLPEDRLFVVPGNHDVNRGIEADVWKSIRELGDAQAVSNWMGGEEPPKGIDGAWRDKILSRTRAFRGWLQKMGRRDLLPEASSHRRLGYRKTLALGAVTVHVIGLDSAWLCGDDHDARAILLTQGQIDALTTDERDGKPLEGFRLALLHHPLDDLRDADNSRKLLAESVDLLLYGHRHETKLEEQSDPDRSMRMIAASSLFEGDEGEHYVNRFHVIDIELNDKGRPVKYELELWAWSSQGFWHPDTARFKRAPQGRLTWSTRPAPLPSVVPAFETAFVGRHREIDECTKLIATARLVTLGGLGGIGKTRLAYEIAEHLCAAGNQFKDGILFVDLSHPAANSPQALVTEIGRRLGDDIGDTEDQIAQALQKRDLLLLLDNCETITNGTIVVARLLRTCPQLHILATSQVRLSIPGEQWFPVPPMAAPAKNSVLIAAALAQFDSFQLFRECVLSFQRDWTLTDHDAPAVRNILALTEGIPLSIQLVAARMDEFAPAEIAERLCERINLLESPGSADPERHASMEACFAWTLNLLPPDVQELFPKLAVFAGGFFADDVEQICEAAGAADGLRSLMKYSLLYRRDVSDRSRFTMLETVRKYAALKLASGGEAILVRLKQRHAQHYLEMLEQAAAGLDGNDHLAALQRIETDEDNIFAGIRTSRQLGYSQFMLRYVLGISGYLRQKARFAKNCELAGDAALRVYTERDFPQDWAATQNNLGAAYWNLPTGDRGANLGKAISCYEAALRVYTERDFPQAWAMTQNNLGNAYCNLPTGDRGANLARAISCYEAALRVYTERDFPQDWAMTQNNLMIARSALNSLRSAEPE